MRRLSSEPTLAARRSPRGCPHRANERLVVKSPGRGKNAGHGRATTFRHANFSDTQIFESNLIGPRRYARQFCKGRLANFDRLAPASRSSVRACTLPRPLSYRRRATRLRLCPDEPPRGLPPQRLTLFSFCSMLGQGWQWPKPEMMSRRKAPSFPRHEASV